MVSKSRKFDMSDDFIYTCIYIYMYIFMKFRLLSTKFVLGKKQIQYFDWLISVWIIYWYLLYVWPQCQDNSNIKSKIDFQRKYNFFLLKIWYLLTKTLPMDKFRHWACNSLIQNLLLMHQIYLYYFHLHCFDFIYQSAVFIH